MLTQRKAWHKILRCKLMHKDCAACGDDFCSFVVIPTTEKERDDFVKKSKDWKRVDPRLTEEKVNKTQ